MPRTIVVGYDGSDCAKAALDEAAKVAADRADSRIVVVNGHRVRSLWGHWDWSGTRPPNPAETEELKRKATAALQPLLDEACARLGDSGVPVEALLAWEHPADALVAVARKESADLIVIGAHGIDSIGHTFGNIILGSTASRLLHQSAVPVLVVPHRAPAPVAAGT